MRTSVTAAQRPQPTPAETVHSSPVGVLLVVLGALCFSTSVIFIRQLSGLSPMAISFYRSLFAFLFFCALLFRYPEALRLRAYRHHVPLLIGLGAAMAITASLYTYAVQRTTASNAQLLVNTSPLYMAVLAPWVLREARPRWTWVGLALAAIGIVLITTPGGSGPAPMLLSGVLAALLAGLTYTLTMVVGRIVRAEVSGFTQIFWGSGVMALVLLPFALASGLGAAGGQWHLLVPMGVISLGLSYLLLFLGLKRCSAQVVSVAALMEPVFGTLWGVLLLGEPLSAAGALGAGLILGAIILISR